jgi:thiamine kinase-like enzyme
MAAAGSVFWGREQRLLRLTCRRIGAGDPLQLERVSGGMTNRNYRVISPAGRFFIQLQLPHDVAATVGISRARQLIANRQAAVLGIAPPVIASWDDPPVLVTAFAQGHSISGDQATDDGLLRQVALLLRTLHSAVPEPGLGSWVSHPFEGTWRNRELARNNDPGFVDEAGWLLRLMADFEAARGPWQPTLTHIDLLASNLILGDRLWLVDWEYAGLGDPLYDLGDFAGKNGLSEADTQALLEYYAGTADPRSVAVVRVYRILSLLREALWAIGMTSVKFNDFDHRKYAREAIQQTAAMAREPETVRHLRLLGCDIPGELAVP